LIGALIMPAQLIMFFLAWRRSRARWKAWLLSVAVLTIPYLPLVVWQLPLLLRPAETGYRFVPLHEMLYSLFVNHSYGVIQRGNLWTAALFVGLLLAVGLFLAEERSRRAAVGILVCWVVVPVLCFFLITLRRPLYTPRYLIYIVPGYLLLLALGLAAIARRSRVLAGLLMVALLAVSGWSLWLQATTPLKADFRAATAYVTERWAGDDLIIFQIPYGRHSFEYYVRQQSVVASEGERKNLQPWKAGRDGARRRWADGLYTNAGMQPAEVDRRMDEITEGSQVVWLVATEVPMWDRKRLVETWLEEHATLADRADWVRVGVYRYELP
jgi:hypothetical protein